MGAQRELLPWQSHLWETALCPDQGWENSGEPCQLEAWLTSGGPSNGAAVGGQPGTLLKLCPKGPFGCSQANEAQGKPGNPRDHRSLKRRGPTWDASVAVLDALLTGVTCR